MSDFVPIVLSTLLCYVLFFLARYIYRDLTTPLRIRDLPGPSNPSLLYGNYKKMEADPELTNKWRDTFGRTFPFRGLFSINELHTSDPKSLAHIAANVPIYTKLPATRWNLERLWGDGITSQEDMAHKLQRRIMMPGFSAKSMRGLTPVFNFHANRLRDIWVAEFSQDKSERQFDVLPTLRRAALDSIGDGGLNYQFNTLGGETSDLIKVLTQLLHSSGSKSTFIARNAQAWFPILRYLPILSDKDLIGPRDLLLKIGAELLAERKAAIVKAKAAGEEPSRDMLSCMIIANDALPAKDRLSDKVLIAQVPTLIIVGHENTSAAVAWVLHRLAAHPDIQTAVRAELLAIASDTPTYDELNSLPLLENVIKETTRLDPSVDFTSRITAADDMLPLSEPFVDKKGRMHTHIPVPKGHKIHMPIRAPNVDKAVWGEDADEFKPDRWDNLPASVTAVPSIFSNLFSFYAGSHSCIGFRWAIIEQKALLFAILRSFEFANAFPPEAIGRTSGTSLARPIVLSEREKGTRMPLLVKPYEKH
ncbi:cytochrome P450 [Mycena capillaripes]|nr:cytochrome P450 [Mycena capillaripes]